MAVQDLVLHFIYDEDSGGKQFYVPGDMLRGTIQLHLRRTLRVRTMNLLILGGAAVSWEQPNKKKLYTAREEYLQGQLRCRMHRVCKTIIILLCQFDYRPTVRTIADRLTDRRTDRHRV